MATLAELCSRGELMPIKVRLSRREFEERSLFGIPAFVKWMKGDVRAANALNPYDIAPRYQVFDLIRRFQTGGSFAVGRTFKRMRPHQRDVFEFTSPDLRVFGWFYRPRVFIAVVGDFMEHTHSGPGIYGQHRDHVVRVRELIELDPPKWVHGASEDDVLRIR